MRNNTLYRYILLCALFFTGKEIASKKCCLIAGPQGPQGIQGLRGLRGATGATGPDQIPFGFVSTPVTGAPNTISDYTTPNALPLFNVANNVSYFFSPAITLNSTTQTITLAQGIYTLNWNLYIPNGWPIGDSPTITLGFYNTTTSSFYTQSLLPLKGNIYVTQGLSVASSSVILVENATENIVFAAQQNFFIDPSSYYITVTIERIGATTPI